MARHPLPLPRTHQGGKRGGEDPNTQREGQLFRPQATTAAQNTKEYPRLSHAFPLAASLPFYRYARVCSRLLIRVSSPEVFRASIRMRDAPLKTPKEAETKTEKQRKIRRKTGGERGRRPAWCGEDVDRASGRAARDRQRLPAHPRKNKARKEEGTQKTMKLTCEQK